MFFNQFRVFFVSRNKMPFLIYYLGFFHFSFTFLTFITCQYLLEEFLTCYRVSSSFFNFAFFIPSHFFFSSFCICFFQSNLTVFLCFKGVEKGCIGNEWVNLDNRSVSGSFVLFIFSFLPRDFIEVFFMMFASCFHVSCRDFVSFSFPSFHLSFSIDSLMFMPVLSLSLFLYICVQISNALL